MLFQWRESKHRQVVFCLYYIVLIYFSFAVFCILVAVKQKHTSSLNPCSNNAYSLLVFQNLHSQFNYFCGEILSLEIFKKILGKKIIIKKKALKYHRLLMDGK